MTPVAPRNVNSVSCVKRIDRENHFSWQAQYLVRLEDDFVAPRIVNVVSYVTRINRECCFVVQSSTGVVLCSTE